MAFSKQHLDKLTRLSNESFSDCYAIYLFGSALTSDFNEQSDLDLGIYSPTPLSAEAVLSFKASVSRHLRRDVDVVDMSLADAVTNAQVVGTGINLITLNPTRAAHFETTVLSKYALLNEERREILADIAKSGTIHG
jgi:predicted nucleotidyltransferase